MTWLHALHWQQPLWLALALLPWILRAWPRRKTGEARLTGFADAHLLPRLLVGRPADAHGLLFAAAWTLAAVAAAGPYWAARSEPVEVRGADIAVVVDISPSMAVADLAPSRLARVKHELRDFVRLLGGDRLALVVFSGNAYPALPLSADRDAFLQFVDLLDPNLTARPGSNLTRAMNVAGRLLATSTPGGRAVVLISDGEFHDAEIASASAALREQGIPLLAVGAATEAGGPVPDAQDHFMRYQGEVVVSRLDRARLQQLAQGSGGAYVELREDDGEWQALLASLRALTKETPHASPAAADAVPLYAWPLAASLVLFLWAGARRRDALVMLLLPLLFTAPSPADAAPWSERQAYEALQAGDYRAAERLYSGIKSYAGAMGAGTAAYRRQDWNAALAAFERAVRSAGSDTERAEALYNAGNTLARLTRYAEAGARYRGALRLRPNFNKAALNLTLVNQLEARRGVQPREDSKHALTAGASPAEGRDLNLLERGDDAALPPTTPPAARGNPEQRRERAGANAEAAAESSEATRADLQQTLTLWRAAGGNGGGAEIDALRDNSAAFLRWRFREDDFGTHVIRREEKPW